MQPLSCLAIDPNPEDIAVLRRACQQLNLLFVSLSTARHAFDEIAGEKFDIVFIDLDYIMEGASDFLKDLDKHLPLATLVFIGTGDAELQAPVDDNIFAIVKPPLTEKPVLLLLRQILRFAELNREVHTLHRRGGSGLKDPSTGIYTDAYLKDRITAEFKRASRYVLSLSVVLIDLNAPEGATRDDAAAEGIRKCASFILKFIRGNDVLIQHGGNQFLLLLPDTSKKGAHIFAERIIRAFREHCPDLADWIPELKVSVGLATYPEDGVKNENGLLELALRALQHAKSLAGDSLYSYKNIGLEDIQGLHTKKKT